jgi:hypothetical protein
LPAPGKTLRSQQRADFHSLGGNQALGGLANPFEWASEPPKRYRNRRGGLRTASAPSSQNGQAGAKGQVSQRATKTLPAAQGGAAAQAPEGAAPPPGAPVAEGAKPPSGEPERAPGAPQAPTPGIPAAPGAEAPTTPPAPGAPPTAGAPEAPSPAAAGPTTGAEAAAAAAAAEDTFGAAAESTGPGLGGGLASLGTAPAMIGDQSPLMSHSLAHGFPPPIPGNQAGHSFYPGLNGFKISENMSPRPQDRFFVSFEYFNNVNDAVDTRLNVPINRIKAYREFFGFEKTFNDGMGSIGLRFPIDSVTANSPGNVFSTPPSTTVGNMDIFAKYILAQNTQTGSLVSVGLSVQPPTGPGNFAGAPYLNGINSIYFQPFLGYIYNWRNWYLHGFCAFDFPASPQDVTMMYNDVGIGYYLYRSDNPLSWVTRVAPTFEVHVNNPINHRDVFNPHDISGTPDVVNFTYGLNVLFGQRVMLSAAYINCVSSPQVFNSEFALLLNIYYGRMPLRAVPSPPIIQ